jgi:hypothetical protein
VTFTTQEYLQLLSVLSDGIVVQEAAEKMSISSDCIRFGLHHEQYLVRLTRAVNTAPLKLSVYSLP